MSLITKYVNVNLSLSKIIPVEEDDSKKAIEKAKKIFISDPFNNDGMKVIDVDYNLNPLILYKAKMKASVFANICEDELTFEKLKEYFDKTMDNSLFSKYVFDETLKILESEYNIIFDKSNIKI